MNEPNLRIAIIGLNYHPEPTGIAPYTTRLAEHLAAIGHHVQVITGFPHYPEWKMREGYSGRTMHEVINGVSVKRLSHFVPTHPSGPQRLYLELSFGIRVLFARWFNPDVVIVVTPALFSSAFALVRTRFGWRRPPAGVWVQDIYSRGLTEINEKNSVFAPAMRIIEGLILRSATRVVVIHHRFKSYVSSHLKVPAEQVDVIRNWTHIGNSIAIDRDITRTQWGWKKDDVVVLHAGNMGKKQGLENVVNAARLADATGSKVRFVLLGDGNQRARIKALSEGIDRLQFIDPVSDVKFRQTIGSADVLLVNELPGLREMAVPSKLTSYFSTGLPVLAATELDSTTAGEILQSRGGLRVDPGAPEELLLAAEQLARDKHLSQELGQAGLHYAETVLAQDAAILKYSEWLRQLSATKRRA
ncbi:glycosyltransferase family 4 protein [Arthrobacter sp. D2-10]